MTIGRKEIIKRIQSRELAVTPLLSPTQIGTSSIDLRMGNVALMARARGSSHVDPALVKSEQKQSAYVAEMRRQQKHERFELPFGAELLLHPGSLALVPTLEWVRVPSNLMGEVTARSTWAREGLSIATATMIEPGYEGIVTLELANLGQIPIPVRDVAGPRRGNPLGLVTPPMVERAEAASVFRSNVRPRACPQACLARSGRRIARIAGMASACSIPCARMTSMPWRGRSVEANMLGMRSRPKGRGSVAHPRSLDESTRSSPQRTELSVGRVARRANCGKVNRFQISGGGKQ